MEVLRSRMRTSMLGLLKLKPEILRKKKSVLKGARKKDETNAGKSELLILILRIMKAQSKEEAREDVRKSHPVSLVGRRPKMADHTGKGHATRSLFMRALVMRIGKKRSLNDQGVIENDLTMASLGTATKMQI